MALTLLDHLFHREVQAASNLSGHGHHGKKQLDRLMVYGIRCELRRPPVLQVWHHRVRLVLHQTAYRCKVLHRLAAQAARTEPRRQGPQGHPRHPRRRRSGSGSRRGTRRRQTWELPPERDAHQRGLESDVKKRKRKKSLPALLRKRKKDKKRRKERPLRRHKWRRRPEVTWPQRRARRSALSSWTLTATNRLIVLINHTRSTAERMPPQSHDHLPPSCDVTIHPAPPSSVLPPPPLLGWPTPFHSSSAPLPSSPAATRRPPPLASRSTLAPRPSPLRVSLLQAVPPHHPPPLQQPNWPAHLGSPPQSAWSPCPRGPARLPLARKPGSQGAETWHDTSRDTEAPHQPPPYSSGNSPEW
ncbi:uncharacterized protein LOC144740902 [Lampetra planeri]